MASDAKVWIKYGQLPPELILKAWEDASFAQKLINDPVNTLIAEGYDVPAGLNITVHQNSSTDISLVLPAPLPALAQLSTKELKAIVELGTKCAGTGTCD